MIGASHGDAVVNRGQAVISRRSVRWALLGVVLFAAAWLRILSLGYGLPDVLNPDEIPILNRALTFAKGDPNPHNFLYPTLYLYATFAWEGLHYVVGRLLGWYGSVTAFQLAYVSDPSRHVLAARLLTALTGTASVLATYVFGRNLYNRAVGIVAAVFLAVAPFAVRDAHYVKLDVPTAMFVAAAHAWMARIIVSPDRWAPPRNWFIAGVLGGLAVSTQYYAVFVAIPLAVTAASCSRQPIDWGSVARRLAWIGLGAAAGFCATSPFFIFEWSSIARDFAELHKVDIVRATRVGPFSSFGRYVEMLAREAVGWPVFALAAAGSVAAIRADWRRGLLLVGFATGFLPFLANTYPVGRYTNVLLPMMAVAAAFAVYRLAALATARLSGPAAPAAGQRAFAACLVALTVASAAPGFVASLRWDRFFRQDDTRTIARRFMERTAAPNATVLLQPHGVDLPVSREALVEALRSNVGDESRASTKFQLRLAAPPPVGYRVLLLGSGLGADALYVSYEQASAPGALERLGVDWVILKTHEASSPAAKPLIEALDRQADLVKVITPYPEGVDPSGPDVPTPFLHNTDARLYPGLERPGPVLSIWRVRRGRP